MPSLRGGGAERVIVNLLQGFTARNVDVDLVVAKAEGPYLCRVPRSVRLIDLKADSVLLSLPALAKYLRKVKPYSLLSVMDHCNIVALWAKTISGTPVKLVFSVHNTLSRETADARSFKVKVFPALIRLFYRFADMIVAVSQGVADDLAAYGGVEKNKIKVIFNPVITPDLFEMAKEAEKSVLKPDFPMIIGVGRLNRQKDFATLLRAFRIVLQHCKARLVILGEGEERESLEALIEDLNLTENAKLYGFADNPYAIMAKADVFVLSSIYEGLPTVLIEALALGIPVVSTDCKSGPREIIARAKSGRLVRVGDIEGMAKAIKETIECDSKQAAKQSNLESYTLDYASDRYLELLR